MDIISYVVVEHSVYVKGWECAYHIMRVRIVWRAGGFAALSWKIRKFRKIWIFASKSNENVIFPNISLKNILLKIIWLALFVSNIALKPH